MEIRVLVAHPADEFRDFRVAAERFGGREAALQLLVAERRVNGAMADRMDRRGLPAAPAFRHRMVPLGPAAQRPLAKEAAEIRTGQRRNQCFVPKYTAIGSEMTTQKPITPAKAQGSSA